ncbi:hypothetical protein HY491_02985 [Candidatus Woesearchaeota archaeon]|nr:hypothetical protein [Candidatus Woesearchaeota archaeon]
MDEALFRHYSRSDVQRAIVAHAQGREVAIKFGEQGFGKRPDIIKYPKDIIEWVKQGATSFHVSEERWSDPLRVSPLMKREALDSLRRGWDLVLDIDCPIFAYSKLCSHLLIAALQYHNIRGVSCKFSGNKGFHIGVPFESFPAEVNGEQVARLFPEGPRKIAYYLKEFIRKSLQREMLREGIAAVIEASGKEFEGLVKDGELDPYQIVEIDTILLASRHLYRMPYCLNEKSGLVSLPINPNEVMAFERERAKPPVIFSSFGFLDNPHPGEARQLLLQALDFSMKQPEREEKRVYAEITDAVPEGLFPPCMKLGLQGMKDGKKRFLFMLLNFLGKTGYTPDQTEQVVREWNKRNEEPLRENYLVGHLRYFRQKKERILPPNCRGQYIDLHICTPDNLCERIRNPVSYARRKAQAGAKKRGKREKAD